MRIVLVDHEGFWARRRAMAGDDYRERTRLAIAAGDGPYFSISEHGFSWECPGCGRSIGGNVGPVPVSGWENPQWVVTGPADAPTMMPSLGCPGWRDGTCSGGHYWLRDGELVPA